MWSLLATARTPFTTADAAALGIDRRTLAGFVKRGVVHRACQSAYVSMDAWRAADAHERYRLRCLGVVRRYDDVALSHHGAVTMLGLPFVDADLRVVHVARMGAGRVGRIGTHPPVQVHSPLPPAATTTVDGVETCTPAVAALQTADWYGTAAGLVAAEAALHEHRITRDDLAAAREVARLGRGRADADAVVRLAGPHSESPGETLTRLLLLTLGVGEVVQQARIPLAGDGTARVDFLLVDSGIVVEFDGRVKYDGVEGRDALVREKRREDAIRAAGHPVVRLTWSDLRRPQHVRALLIAAGWRPA